MPFSLRQRGLTCFYCGSRSSQSLKQRARQWQCEHCDAVNHLDKHGHFTEPPSLPATTDTPPAPRFAHVPNRSSSPPTSFSSSEPLFCATCLKNQHLLTETLAAYLPPPEHPQYPEYEQSYPAYRAKLEQRYPQVCRACLPAVKDRIRKAGYIAKTDHLRRMVEQTRRNGVVGRPNLGWRGLLLRMGGLGWGVSLVLQGSWHVLGCLALMSPMKVEGGDGLDPTIASDALEYGSHTEMLMTCVRHALTQRQIHPECLQEVTSWVPTALALAAWTLWWNNKLRRNYETTGTRMTGLADFYVLQILVLIIRLASYWVLSDPTGLGLSASAFRGAHAFMAFSLLLLVPASLSIVKVGRHMIKFHSDEDLLVLPDSADNAETFSTPAPRRTDAADLLTPRPFPIENLAAMSASRTFPTPLHQTPTPPPEEDDTETDMASEADAMDWTPTTSKTVSFTPRSAVSSRFLTPAQQAPTAPSPFYGTLPKAPIPPAHKLRNPIHTTPPFHKASKETQQSFFASLTAQRSSPAVRAGVDDFEDDNKRAEFNMAPPRLFLQQDKIETGLEAMFDEVFSIKDEPSEVRKGSSRDAASASGADGESVIVQPQTSHGWITLLVTAMVPVAILVGVTAWVKSPRRASWEAL